MSTLYNYFTKKEIELILIALEAQEKKWKAVANRPVQGYGKASEYEKKKEAAKKANQFFDLQIIISENTD